MQSIYFANKKAGPNKSWLGVHTTKSNISNLENGNHGCSSALLKNLALAFECNISYLFLLAEQLDESSDGVKNAAQTRLLPLGKFYALPVELQATILKLIEQISTAK